MKLRRSILIIATLLILGFTTIPAYADQAAWVSRAEAAKALRILAEYGSIKHYCAPCDSEEVRDEVINDIGMFSVEGGKYWEIRVNGKGIDLAYVYFPKKQNQWVNAAMQAKIKVSDVPKKLSRSQIGR